MCAQRKNLISPTETFIFDEKFRERAAVKLHESNERAGGVQFTRTRRFSVRTPCGGATPSVEGIPQEKVVGERLRLTVMRRRIRHLILPTCGKLRSQF